MIIEGDNLEVLKLLQKSYYGKVKMIYIDPPYNTGKEFIYPDNFREGLHDYLRYSGQVDDEGIKLSTNTETSGRYHSKWLSMMYPRLFLARNLLREDGVIFVSIDDHEAFNLHLLMDEIFGSENCVSQFVWNSSTAGGLRSKHVNQNHEYALCYCKSIDSLPMLFAPLSEEAIQQYNRADNRGRYREKDFAWSTKSKNTNQRYLIECPDGSFVQPRQGYLFRFTEERFNRALSDEEVVFKETNTSPLVNPQGEQAKWNIYIKKYLGDGTGAPASLVPKSLVGISNVGTGEIKELFDRSVFNNPKSTQYLKYYLEMGLDKDDIILDFFAGSCSTAHTTLLLNQKDNGTRKFIMVQLPEATDDTEFDTIYDLGRTRIKRVLNNLNSQAEDNLAQSSTQDLGFKAFKLADSNFKTWDAETTPSDGRELAQQLALYADNVQPGRSEQDILYELLLKAGLSLTDPIAKIDLDGGTVYNVADGLLLICLAERVNAGLLRAMMEMEPMQIICLDQAFGGNDQLKTNTVLEMRDQEIQFRTV